MAAVTVDIGAGAQAFPIERIHAAPYAVSARSAHSAELAVEAENGVPLGGIVWWTQPSGVPIPSGFVACTGGTVNDATSPIDGAAIPDLRNRFIQGASTATPGTNRGASSTTTSTNGDHNHIMYSFEASSKAWFAGASLQNSSGLVIDWGDGMDSEGANFYPIAVDDPSQDELHATFDNGDHNHTISEPVPRHVELVALMRIR